MNLGIIFYLRLDVNNFVNQNYINIKKSYYIDIFVIRFLKIMHLKTKRYTLKKEQKTHTLQQFNFFFHITRDVNNFLSFL